MTTQATRFLSRAQALARMRRGDLPTQGGGYTSALYFDDGARTTGPTGHKLVRDGVIDRPQHTSVSSRYTLAATTFGHPRPESLPPDDDPTHGEGHPPVLSVRAACHDCGSDLTTLPTADGERDEDGYWFACESCGTWNVVRTDDINELQHTALVLLGEDT